MYNNSMIAAGKQIIAVIIRFRVNFSVSPLLYFSIVAKNSLYIAYTYNPKNAAGQKIKNNRISIIISTVIISFSFRWLL